MTGPSPEVSSETRQNRPYSLSLTSPTLSRPWSQQAEIDRFATVPHTLSDISDNVSPISTQHITKELPPIPSVAQDAPVNLSGEEALKPIEEHNTEIPEQLRIIHPRFSRLQRPRLRITPESDFIIEDARASRIHERGTVIARKPLAVSGLPVESIRPTPSSISPQPHLQPHAVVSTNTLGNHIEVSTGGRRRASQVITQGFTRWSKVIYGYLFLLIPVPFFALSIGLAIMNGKATKPSDHWEVYQNLMKIAGTLFPIAFALLFGRAMLKIASYSLERGSTLERLELLIGSQTFGGAIGAQLKLRSFNYLGFTIVVLFILSPIGSQGFLRLLSPNTTSKTSSASTPFFTTDSQSHLADTDVSSWPASAVKILNSLYVAAILAPISVKASPVDLWANIKIPFLSSLPRTSSTEFVPVTSNTTLVYVSLVGVPVSGLQNGRTAFSLESSYLELNCGVPKGQIGFFNLTTLKTSTSIDNGTFYGTPGTADFNGTASWSIGHQGSISPMFNSTQSIPSPLPKVCLLPQVDTQIPSQPFISAPCALSTLGSDQVQPSALLFQAAIPSAADGATIQAFCQTKTVYVESKVLCNGNDPEVPISCRVIAQRNSVLPHAPGLLTPLAFPDVFSQLSTLLPRAFSTTFESRTADPSLLYLIDPDPATLVTTSVTLDVANITGEVLSRRLAQLINTYYTLSQAPTIIPLGNPSSGMMKGYPSLTASVTLGGEFWKVSWGWFTVAIAGTLVMFIAGVVAIIMDLKTSGPEVLGTVSGMLMDSKLAELETNEGESPREVTRRNKKLRLRRGPLNNQAGAPVGIARENDIWSMKSRGRSMYQPYRAE